MKRAIAFLGLALLAAGCGGKDSPKPEVAAVSKPAPDEAKACIAGYLGQCGWKDVELVAIADSPSLPKGTPAINGEAWAFTFSAQYTNILGERQATENWIAVVARSDGKACVTSCFDHAQRMVGGHSGAELADKGTLTAQPAGPDLPEIVAPKP
jgi:hypothetical protein